MQDLHGDHIADHGAVPLDGGAGVPEGTRWSPSVHGLAPDFPAPNAEDVWKKSPGDESPGDGYFL